MGLRSDVQTAIGAAFTGSLADAVQDYVFTQRGDSVYDPVTGLVTAAEVDWNTRGVFDQPSDEQLTDSNVRPFDTVIITLQNELGASAVNPNDLVTMGSGKELTVYKVQPDPAAASWNIFARDAADA
jgi:hypothetical protein